MAQVTYRQEAFAPREFGATYLRRMMSALRFQLQDFALDLERCATSAWSAMPADPRIVARPGAKGGSFEPPFLVL